MLDVHGISKWFGGNAVISDLSFSIQQGEVVGLIGPNGAGKTTVFNVVSGFYRSRTGYIRFNDMDITRLPPEAICSLGLCRTFQITRPFSNISVTKNVMIGALNREKSVRKAEKRAEEVLEFVGLHDRRHLLGRNLTIADRKRLEIAKGLATSPKLFLLDEVMAGLNPAELQEMIKLIRQVADSGIVLFVIEHIMAVIMGLSHRIIVLNHGEKIAEGEPSQIASDAEVIKAYLGEEYLLAQG
ncbi:MAG TPA: ABC transporter ATP-binding protein [Syntrophorhabdales bacterium]|nr:ABC transporter ATP-binding protein [Syntrophorhabdales bacterium]